MKVLNAILKFFAWLFGKPNVEVEKTDPAPKTAKDETKPKENAEDTQAQALQQEQACQSGEPEASKKLRVKIKNLRVRAYPGLQGEVLGFAECGRVYDFSEVSVADGYRWYKVGEGKWLADDNEGSLTLNWEKESFIFPVRYIAVTEYFSDKHLGIDLGWNTSRGFSPEQSIYAAFSASVVKVWNFNDAGLTARLRYDDIDEGVSYYAQYKHLSACFVKEGETVAIGDEIGRMGATGGDYGNHLHFDLIRCPLGYDYRQVYNEERRLYSVDPLLYLTAQQDFNVFSYDESCLRGVRVQ